MIKSRSHLGINAEHRLVASTALVQSPGTVARHPEGNSITVSLGEGGGAGLHVPVGDPGGRDGVDEGRLAGPVTQHHVADQLQGDRVDESAVPPEGAMSSQL